MKDKGYINIVFKSTKVREFCTTKSISEEPKKQHFGKQESRGRLIKSTSAIVASIDMAELIYSFYVLMLLMLSYFIKCLYSFKYNWK